MLEIRQRHFLWPFKSYSHINSFYPWCYNPPIHWIKYKSCVINDLRRQSVPIHDVGKSKSYNVNELPGRAPPLSLFKSMTSHSLCLPTQEHWSRLSSHYHANVTTWMKMTWQDHELHAKRLRSGPQNFFIDKVAHWVVPLLYFIPSPTTHPITTSPHNP